MSPLPGAARGNAPPRGRPDAPAHQLRHALAALLLTVLTLVGGSSAAAGAAVPLRALTDTAPVTGTAPATGITPGTGTEPATGIRPGTAPITGSARVTGSAAGPRTPVPLTPTSHDDRTPRAGQARDHRPVRAAGTDNRPAAEAPSSGEAHSTAATAPERRVEAAPLPGPRAGADRPLALHHFPPPGHGALPPSPPGLPLPRALAQGAAGTALFVPGRVRAALPGVRGPPRATAGQPAPHRSCSTDPSSRPL
ncbi:hypothetical protein [Streptomyces clavifer]|uniref:hypothetical protein n=1 Tax=Streptomyces clavifer TaxID=68188 RepID=UPI00308E87C3|nr:hypothetical protein OG388_30425 [Streptomyces clavifer]